MHKAHKRVHDPQLVKHLPERNHKANMVHLEGCCRERCGVGSETLLFVKWNALISKSIWTKIFLWNRSQLSWCRVFVDDLLPHCMAFLHAFIISYSMGLTPRAAMQAEGLCWLFGSILFHCKLPTGIIPQGFVSSCQHVRGCFLVNQAFCLVLFFARSLTDTFLYKSHWY